MRIIPIDRRSKDIPPSKVEATSPWKLGGLTPIQLGKRVWHEFNADNLLDESAKLSYYFLLALFPMLIFLLTIAGLLVGNNPNFQVQILNWLTRSMPGDAASLIAKTIQEIARASGGVKLLLSLAGALWAASGGITAVATSLNSAYGVTERRSYIRRKIIHIGLTVAVSVLAILAMVMILFGGPLTEKIGTWMGLGGAAVIAWKIAQWPIALVFIVVIFAIVYYFAPNLRDQKWYWITPGSLVGTFLWIAASLLFKLYLAHFNSYSASYGSLAGVVVLMLWFYITGLAVLTGGEMNSEIEHAAADRGRRDAKAEGEKKPMSKLSN